MIPPVYSTLRHSSVTVHSYKVHVTCTRGIKPLLSLIGTVESASFAECVARSESDVVQGGAASSVPLPAGTGSCPGV